MRLLFSKPFFRVACRTILNTHTMTMKRKIQAIPARKLRKLKMTKPANTATTENIYNMNGSNSYTMFMPDLQKKPA